jgi:hypothetical protein
MVAKMYFSNIQFCIENLKNRIKQKGQKILTLAFAGF